MFSHHLLNIHLNNLPNQELDQILTDWLNGNKQKTIVTPNPEFLLLARQDREFAEILNNSDLSLPDGFGLNLALLIFGKSIHRHTGVDVLLLLASLCVKNNKKLFLFGGKKCAQKTAEVLRQKLPQLNIAFFEPDKISDDGEVENEIIERINKEIPTVLAVALGQGKQERFIAKNLAALQSVRIAIGVGGALDMISGKTVRAPLIMRFLGLEWLWRLIIEPKRWRRIFRAVVIFPIVVFWDKLMGLGKKDCC